MSQKILSKQKLQKVIRALQASGKKVVFTNGCFDIIHAGHVRYLRQARSLGDLLVVGLNSDKSVRRLKGKGRPLVKEADRAELLAALEMVDYVTVFGEDTPAALIEALRPDVLVKGGDYRVGEVVGKETVEASGGRVVIVPFVRGRSTTRIVKNVNFDIRAVLRSR